MNKKRQLGKWARGMGVAAMVCAAGISGLEASTGVNVGDEAPAFSGVKIGANDKLALGDWKGKKAVFVNIFNSWCGPCKGEAPAMVKAYEAYRSKGIEFISICTPWSKDTPEKAAAFSAQYQIPWATIFDHDGSITKKYEVSGVPTNCLVGKDGKVLFYHAGGLNEGIFNTVLEAGVAGKAPVIPEFEAQRKKMEEELQARKETEAKALAAREGKPWFGVSIADLTPAEPQEGEVEEGKQIDLKGIQIQSVVKGGPAESAGLKEGDVILARDGMEVTNTKEFIEWVGAQQPGQKMKLEIKRAGETLTIPCKIGKFSAKLMQP